MTWKLDKEKSEIMKRNYHVKFLNEKDVELAEAV
ncbi:GNAT family N-acetyltransferase, partial [Listeria monocytogenes]